MLDEHCMKQILFIGLYYDSVSLDFIKSGLKLVNALLKNIMWTECNGVRVLLPTHQTIM